MKVYTDYPFEELGDIPYSMEQVTRQVEVIGYDFDKYCSVEVEGYNGILYVKSGYLYKKCSAEGMPYIHLNCHDLNMLPSSNNVFKREHKDWLDIALRFRPSVHKTYVERYWDFKSLMEETKYKHRFNLI